MINIFEYIKEYINNIFITFPSVGFSDIIEIIIITVALYHILKWLKNTRVWSLFNGVLILFLFSLFAAVSKLDTIYWILSKSLNVGIIAAIIIFQPELRKVLEQLGQKNVISKLFVDKNENRKITENVIDDLAVASFEMGEEKTGALIIIERETPLGEYADTGIRIDGLISVQLIKNIFEHNTPLHDGAIIIKGNKIISATCYLPLSNNNDIEKKYGTRHRAALGISEVSDSMTIVVSEETGEVSLAMNGVLYDNLSVDELKGYLFVLIDEKEEMKIISKWKEYLENHEKNRR